MNHMQSLRFEHKLYAQVKQKMEEMQQHNMSWIEVQFLKKAVDVLCQCRSTLMFTYVFAFYLKKNNQSIIFEVWLKCNFLHKFEQVACDINNPRDFIMYIIFTNTVCKKVWIEY